MSIRIQQCRTCSTHYFPDRWICGTCSTNQFDYVDAETGTVEEISRLADGTVLATVVVSVPEMGLQAQLTQDHPVRVIARLADVANAGQDPSGGASLAVIGSTVELSSNPVITAGQAFVPNAR